eukprot:8932811-Pyramimonas_sp.AAC.1
MRLATLEDHRATEFDPEPSSLEQNTHADQAVRSRHFSPVLEQAPSEPARGTTCLPREAP